MSLILPFILGFTTSLIGNLIPSMLNMTAAKISLNKSKSDAIKFALGVSIVVMLQAYIAILFTKFLNENPNFLNSLQEIAIVIFALLSFYFYRQYKKDKNPREKNKEKAGNNFMLGLLLSTLNMFAIPYYCAVTTALNVAGWLQFSQQNVMIFVVGSGLGTFLLLFLYANYARIFQLKSKGLTKNLDLVLSILTGILAIITLIKVV